MPQMFDAKKAVPPALVAAKDAGPKSAKGALKGVGFAEAAQQLAPEPARGEAKKGDAKAERFAPGTELYVQRTGYNHAGVYVGNNEVIHVFAEPGEAFANLVGGKSMVHVQRTSLAEFAEGDKVSAGPHATTFTPEEAVRRAESKEGSGWSYDPVSHNCQHFSSWAVCGSAHSPEAAAFKRAFTSVGGAIVGGAEDAAGAVASGAKGAASTVAGGAKEVGSALVGGGKSAASTVAGGAKSAADKVGGGAKKLGKKLKGLF